MRRLNVVFVLSFKLENSFSPHSGVGLNVFNGIYNFDAHEVNVSEKEIILSLQSAIDLQEFVKMKIVCVDITFSCQEIIHKRRSLFS